MTVFEPHPPFRQVAVALFRGAGRATVILYPVVRTTEDGFVTVRLASGDEGPAEPRWTVYGREAALEWLRDSGFDQYRDWPGGATGWIRTFPDELDEGGAP